MEAFQVVFLLAQLFVAAVFIYIFYMVFSKLARMFAKTTRKTKAAFRR